MAKDIAAGAVLIAAVNAVVIGYLVFADRLTTPELRLVNRLREAPINLTLIALVLIILIVIASKALTGRGTPLSRRTPVRPRRARVRRLDGDHVHRRRPARRRLLRRADHGAARRADAGRVRHPHDVGGRARRRDRYARDDDPLPGARVTDQELVELAQAAAGRTRTRPTRSSTSARPRSCATAA